MKDILIKKWDEFVSDLLESRTYTHELGKSTAILIKWLSYYGMKYKVNMNHDTNDFQLYLWNDNFTKDKFNIIVNMMQTLGYFPAVINVDNRNLLNDYKEYVNFNHKIKNNKKDLDYIDFLNNLEITDDFNEIYVQFERYMDGVLDVNNIPDTLYHVCKVIYVDKIKKNGLCPKNQNKILYHPERIYLTSSDAEKLLKMFNNGDSEQYTVLEIRMDDYFKKHIQLKKDPNYENGYYTLTSIPPHFIF